jgi:UDP-N-acetylmuramoyl-tripeptide--D-alanyl-D-alanine ligase
MKISTETLYDIYKSHPLIITDSRKVVEGCLFFALKGETFDGNVFAGQAIQNGAAYSISDNPENDAENVIIVDDVLRILQNLASLHRDHLHIPVIGITGTNGKTTTKELTCSVLSSHFNTHATTGNFNNHLGVPLTILSASPATEILIVEMGANHVGEIEDLCKIAKPTLGLITNIGRAHLEGFGGFEGVVKAKSELYNYLRENKGHAFVNGDNPLLMNLSANMERTFYGTSLHFESSGSMTASDPFLKMQVKIRASQYEISTNLIGQYNFENVMAAVCVGEYLNLPAEKIVKSIADYRPGNSRSQAIDTGKNKVIADFYNANPSSMKVALENFGNMKAEKKMVILGDMFELGNESEAEHQAIVKLVEGMGLEKVIFAGPEFMKAAAGSSFTCFKNSSEIYEWLKKENPKDYTVLLKGSRGSRMETVLPSL